MAQSPQRRRFLSSGLLSATTIVIPRLGFAQDSFPNKPIRIIVAAAAGGNLDITVRVIALRMSETLGQSFVIENRAGGNSLPATRFVKESAADGYTLLAMSNTMVISPNFIAKPGYDTIKDFVGVGMMNRLPMLLVTSSQKPDKTFSAFLERARLKPDQVSFASSGIGTATHLPAAMLEQHGRLKMLHIPYKGNAPAIADVLSGRVDVLFDTISTSVAYVREGRFIALGITTPNRSPLFPNVPTIAEMGFPGYDFTVYTGLVAPVGTPSVVVRRLHDALQKATAAPELRESFLRSGTELFTHPTPELFTDYLQNEVTRYAKLVKDANIKPEEQ